MMVGDPNQSIFAFNGSNSDFMIKNFVNDYQAKTIELKENYRSSRQVLEAAEKIMPDSNDIVNLVIPGIFEIHPADNEYQEAEYVCNKIIKLIDLKEHNDIEGEISFEKIVVLARNRYVFSQLETIFKDKNIPFYFKTTPGAIKFETDIMKIFDLTFRVRINPDDKLHLGRLLKVLKINNLNVNSLNELTDNINNDIHKNIISLVLELAEDGSNFKLLVEKFKNSIEQLSYNSDDEKKMILDEINELLIHWYQYAKKTERKSLSQFKNSMALGQTNPNTQQNGITLSTVHTMKGQEYDIVFIIGMDEGTFPDYRAVTAGGIELIQEKNNAYVAFTRSKRFLFVSYPKQRIMPWGDVKTRAISRFLKVFNN
jgi:DNA helicase-2/ATP-dependent DNA helicase PcrA